MARALRSGGGERVTDGVGLRLGERPVVHQPWRLSTTQAPGPMGASVSSWAVAMVGANTTAPAAPDRSEAATVAEAMVLRIGGSFRSRSL